MSSESKASNIQTQPAVTPPLDPAFVPAYLFRHTYRKRLENSGNAPEKLLIAVERENGQETLTLAERHVKFMVWAFGGWKVHLSGPGFVCNHIRDVYAASGARAFDNDLMSGVYGQPFTVNITDAANIPEPRERSSELGGHMSGCRIGFDLGASDYKIAAVRDGEPVFSTEIPWDPVPQTDPEYHYSRVNDALKTAASHLPRVDAIGGSAAGIYIDNEVKVASLFRSVPKDLFASTVKPMFRRLQREWNVPLVVVNDGDVTALAGALSLETTGILGIAMGSSEAVGYLNRDGRIPGYLNELAFAPVDYGADAAVDEWSGDRGVGALYFSQQAVNRLAPAAGFEFPREMPLPERLKEVQKAMGNGHDSAADIFRTIGVYLGYSLAHYADYYPIQSALILGRVTSGRGGEIIISTADEVLQKEFPELARKISVHVPDEKSRRVGQSVAAASLPAI